jgi:hypothetical protein
MNSRSWRDSFIRFGMVTIGCPDSIGILYQIIFENRTAALSPKIWLMD